MTIASAFQFGVTLAVGFALGYGMARWQDGTLVDSAQVTQAAQEAVVDTAAITRALDAGARTAQEAGDRAQQTLRTRTVTVVEHHCPPGAGVLSPADDLELRTVFGGTAPAGP